MATQVAPNPSRVNALPVREIDMTVSSADRVHWGAIIAGIFAAISVMIVLMVLGLAVGFLTFAPGTPAGSFLVGAGVWDAISVLIAFFIGGGTAAHLAAVSDRGNGALNGALVWLVAIPLLVYTLIGGLGIFINTATNTLGTAAQAAIPAAQSAATTVAGVPGAQATVQGAAAQAAPTLAAAATTVSNIPAQTVQNAASAAGGTALSLLLWLGLGLLAATLGGYVGTRSEQSFMARMGRSGNP